MRAHAANRSIATENLVAGSLFAKAVAALARAARVWRARRLRRAEIRQLAEADEHMLHDIGVTRAEVHAALAGTAFGDPARRVRRFGEDRGGR
jgi:uncharacterized protein YjiS (DUF1127 family)